MQAHIRWIIAVMLAAMPLLGCGKADQGGPAGANRAASHLAAAPAEPALSREHNGSSATIQPTADSGITRITLTAESAKRLGVQVAQVTAAGTSVAAPHSALLHDASGGEWVYVSPQPMVFKRIGVKIERIEGDKMYLAVGPAAGTNIVTIGAAGLFGAEFEYGHK